MNSIDFLYQFIFVDQAKGHISHTKTFSVFGYALMCWGFFFSVLENQPADFNLWIVFGAVVVGNRSLNNYLSKKTN